jgi:hypothetical protein
MVSANPASNATERRVKQGGALKQWPEDVAKFLASAPEKLTLAP